MSTVEDPSQKVEKAHCNKCQGDTNHFIRGSYEVRGDEGPIWWIHTHEMLSCCGCDEVKFRFTEHFSEWEDYEYNESGESVPVNRPRITYFPPAKWRREPSWMNQLHNTDEFMGRVLAEVYTALHADSTFLACIGARTIIDRIISTKVGNNSGFKAGLKELENKGIIASVDVEAINAALEAGHASTHRGWVPARDQIETVMDIIENLVERVVLLSSSAKKLKKKIPKRRRVSK